MGNHTLMPYTGKRLEYNCLIKRNKLMPNLIPGDVVIFKGNAWLVAARSIMDGESVMLTNYDPVFKFQVYEVLLPNPENHSIGVIGVDMSEEIYSALYTNLDPLQLMYF